MILSPFGPLMERLRVTWSTGSPPTVVGMDTVPDVDEEPIGLVGSAMADCEEDLGVGQAARPAPLDPFRLDGMPRLHTLSTRSCEQADVGASRRPGVDIRLSGRVLPGKPTSIIPRGLGGVGLPEGYPYFTAGMTHQVKGFPDPCGDSHVRTGRVAAVGGPERRRR